MQGLTRNELIDSARTAAVAEVSYLDTDGLPRGLAVTPLLLGEDPAFTLTYADTILAHEIGRSPTLAMVFSDSRMAYVGWNPLAVTSEVEMIPDPEGELFNEKLLEQELRKFPPSRLLIDSLLLRRENWWYMPRWILRLKNTDEPSPVVRRAAPDQGVLFWSDLGVLCADTVRVNDWDADRIKLHSLAERNSDPSPDAPSALFYHDFSIPDLEQRTTFLARGHLRGDYLSVKNRTGSRVLGRRSSLFARLRNLRSLRKRCTAGIKEHA